MDKDLIALARLADSENRRLGSQRRTLVILMVCVGLGLGVIAYALHEVVRSQPAKVVIDFAKLPPPEIQRPAR
jgi:hypothetical protein